LEKQELSKLENKPAEEKKQKPERKMLEFKQDMEQIKKSFVKLVEIRKLYSNYFNKLLNMLTQRKNNENLQYLRFRLDFSLELEISSM
jgi:single-stranded DNA-specific DHH superfamily exonuclease